MRLVHVAALAAVIALALAACDVAYQTGTQLPAQQAPTPLVPPDPGPPVAPDALVAAAADRDGKTVHVKGFFLAADGKARLCSVVMESYPPQCGGGTVTLDGQVPAEVAAGLEKTSEPGLAQATWGWVDVIGTFEASGSDGTPTILVSEIRLAAP